MKTKPKFKQAPASMSPAHLQHYASTGQLSESLPSSQVNAFCSCLLLYSDQNKNENTPNFINQAEFKSLKFKNLFCVCGKEEDLPRENNENEFRFLASFILVLIIILFRFFTSHDEGNQAGESFPTSSILFARQK